MSRRDEDPRIVDQPIAGCFEMQLVRRGPWVAASINQDAQSVWSATIDGVPCGPGNTDPALAIGVMGIWHSARRIGRVEHDYRLALKAWALANSPSHPAANPREPIDLGAMPSVF